MHAASVHPEPGSNSLKYVIYTALRLSASRNSYLEFCSRSLLLKSFRRYLYRLFFVQKNFRSLCLSCCSIFKEPAAALVDSLFSISLLSFLVNTFLLGFFNLFGFLRI